MSYQSKFVKRLAVLWLLCCGVLPALGQEISRDRIRQAADLFVTSYNAKDYARLEQEFNDRMRAFLPLTKLTEFLDRTYTGLGRLNQVGEGKFPQPGVGVFPAEFENGKMDLLIALDAQGKWAGFSITVPKPTVPPNTSRNKTKLALPFQGEWLVFWGGDTQAQNQHHDAPTQRFAFDILKVDARGLSFRGEGRRNEDYYAFGQPVLAPAAGVVTYVVDGVQDNAPGEMNRMYVPGNMVIIKHAEGEYSLLAHFKQNSIRVRVGQKVGRGQVLGLCGNTGNSSEPHLHYQFQNSPFFADEASMKTYFEKLTIKHDGKTESKTDYSPVKGDLISPN